MFACSHALEAGNFELRRRLNTKTCQSPSLYNCNEEAKDFDPQMMNSIVDISCGIQACVARKNDGTAVAWGHPTGGGDARGPAWPLIDITDISCGGQVCVARKNDDTAVAWGYPSAGGDLTGVVLTNIADISCGSVACVARKKDGTAISWGDSARGGVCSCGGTGAGGCGSWCDGSSNVVLLPT